MWLKYVGEREEFLHYFTDHTKIDKERDPAKKEYNAQIKVQALRGVPFEVEDERIAGKLLGRKDNDFEQCDKPSKAEVDEATKEAEKRAVEAQAKAIAEKKSEDDASRERRK